MAVVWSDQEAIELLNRKSERICLEARNWDRWRYSLGEWHLRHDCEGYCAYLQDTQFLATCFLRIRNNIVRTHNMEAIARSAVELIEEGIRSLDERCTSLSFAKKYAGSSIITNQRQLREG